MSDDEDDDDGPVPAAAADAEDELPSEDAEQLDDELLAPWYGPAAFARVGDGTGAGRGSSGPSSLLPPGMWSGSSGGGGSGRRRRPRSSSGDDLDPAAGDLEAAAAARGGSDADMAALPQHSRRRCISGSSGRQQQHWWDVFSGGSGRLLQRCVGQCNVQTDIKEAVFLGQDDALVACGSDDGFVFIYNSHTGGTFQQAD